jgi:hypothetical protein
MYKTSLCVPVCICWYCCSIYPINAWIMAHIKVLLILVQGVFFIAELSTAKSVASSSSVTVQQ